MSQHRIRVCPVVPARNDATSFYRGMGPLFSLQGQVDWLDIVFMQHYDWSAMKLLDVMFMHRPATQEEAKLALMARQNGKALWVDYDDDLTAIPMENLSCYSVYMTASVQKSIRDIIRIANVVSVSTPQLKLRLAQQAQVDPAKIVIIPNAIDDITLSGAAEKRLPDLDSQRASKPRLMFWRGTMTHHRDLLDQDEALQTIGEAIAGQPKTEWQMAFMGYSPWNVAEYWDARCRKIAEASDKLKAKEAILSLNKPVFYEASDVVSYFQTLREQRIRVMMVPLTDNLLNRSKSNNAWIEACYAGALTVAPDWPEWRRPGVINYSTSPDDRGKTFIAALTQAYRMSDADAAREAAKGWACVHDSLRLSRVNRQRAQILQRLADVERYRI